LPAYLTQAEADTLAAAMLNLDAWGTASSAQKTAALEQASYDLDDALAYQGQKYDPTQALQFPRVARSTGVEGPYPPGVPTPPSVVWDWDDDTNAAVVPPRVLRACLAQANDILDGGRKQRLDAIHDGLASQSTGSLSESYRADALRDAKLCREAMQLVECYRLKFGRLM